LRYRRGIGIAGIALEAKNDHALHDTDLRGRKPCPVFGCHGIPHIGQQRFEGCGVDNIDLGGNLQQTRISHF